MIAAPGQTISSATLCVREAIMPAAAWRSPSTPGTTNDAGRDTSQQTSWIPSSGTIFPDSFLPQKRSSTLCNVPTMGIGYPDS